MDGEPLTSASTLTFFCEPGVPIVKTMQVKRGIVDDYEDLTIKLASTTCASIGTLAKFSVHFMPESSPVSISYPRDKWVMNTLSARDSIGYYLPITIDGFNVHHKNFDHIEFQYKLSTENNDAWVNACSFFANDSLYALATGNKAKIENGRILPLRFGLCHQGFARRQRYQRYPSACPVRQGEPCQRYPYAGGQYIPPFLGADSRQLAR